MSKIILFVVVLSIGGCGCRDITMTDEVRARGCIGMRYELSEEFEIVSDRAKHNIDVIWRSSDPMKGASEHAVAKVSPGTRLVVVRVDECAMFGYTSALTIARIDNGPLEGTLVVTNHAGIGYREQSQAKGLRLAK